MSFARLASNNRVACLSESIGGAAMLRTFIIGLATGLTTLSLPALAQKAPSGSLAEARAMLDRAVAAVKADNTKSLRAWLGGGFQRAAGLIQGGERGRFAIPVPLRTDFDANALRAMARQTKDGPQARRLLALAAIYEGATRTEAARIGGVTVQIVRDWVVKFNAQGPDGLVNRKPPGQPSKLTDAHRAALVARVDEGPIPAIHGVVRWRLIDLIQWIWEEFRITIAKQTLSRELRAMDYRKLSARPRHHAKSEAAVSAFKKTSRPVWRRSGRRSAASR